MQQAGPSPKRRRFHCREQDWGGGWMAQSAKDEGCGQIGQVTAALGRMQVGEDCSVVLNLIQEIQAQSTPSDAHVSSSQRAQIKQVSKTHTL